jgi:hypothetical protein
MDGHAEASYAKSAANIHPHLAVSLARISVGHTEKLQPAIAG